MNKQSKRLILLFSLILVIIPTVIFPDRLGLPLMSGSAVFMLFEVAFYGFVLFLFRRDANLQTLTMGAALLLVYRMAVGAVFSLAIIIKFGTGIATGMAFSLGMTKYMPAVLLHVLATPLVLRPVFVAMVDGMVERQMPPRPVSTGTGTIRPKTDKAAPAVSRIQQRLAAAPSQRHRPEQLQPQPGRTDSENQFEKAVTYLGEAASVQMAMLVDEEGLPLARFSRCNEDEDLWAPLAIILEGHNSQVLNRYRRGGDPEKIDITTKHSRILVRRIERVVLVVLADHEVDETVLIRIAQAADMIRKYMSERYSPALFARVEERYVSNT